MRTLYERSKELHDVLDARAFTSNRQIQLAAYDDAEQRRAQLWKQILAAERPKDAV